MSTYKKQLCSHLAVQPPSIAEPSLNYSSENTSVSKTRTSRRRLPAAFGH